MNIMLENSSRLSKLRVSTDVLQQVSLTLPVGKPFTQLALA